nr:RNA-directed DNA polymerase, eukaryota [Tanacetum cinerariifolium]
ICIDDTLSLSHLFYADDAIFIGKWERANVITIVQMLKCFFMASGLQINIHKSKLMGIGVFNKEVNAAANIIGCATFSSPFTYLGVKVGMSFSRRKYWDEVIGKISARLSKWKIKTLSIGGRLMLIKSVLTSLPLYHMLLYKAPLGVLHDLETLRRKFFNCIDKNENFWINDTPLNITFPQLYALENRKNITVAEKLNDAALITSFRRVPRGGVEDDQFVQLGELVGPISLSDSKDHWTWILDSSGEFFVHSARTYIDNTLLPDVGPPTRWLKVVPNKINIFAWKISLDKLPSRLNLSLRGIDIPSITCPICCLNVESCSYLFFSCSFARLIWRKVARWWDIDILDFDAYDDWISWFYSFWLPKVIKEVLEGVFYVMWWEGVFIRFGADLGEFAYGSGNVVVLSEDDIPVSSIEAAGGSKEIVGLMLMTMEPEIQRNLEPLHAHEMLRELKTLFAQQAEQELLQTTRDFHSYRQEEGQSVSSYVLKMKGYIDNLEHLGHPVTLSLGVSLILIGLCKEYNGFVQNYNMHIMGKTVNELHAMLKLYEQTLSKINAPALNTVRAGKAQKGVISVSRLYEDSFVNHFVDNTIQVYKNNVVYFSAIPRDGIFEIDLSNSLTNESSIYAVSNKRAKLDLDFALLWHCRLGHISKKRIEKLQHDGLLDSSDLRAFKKCVSCMSGKMAREPYIHQVEKAKDLLGLIHTDEVENQLGKTIKSLRSDRGGEYMSQEFLDHLKDHGIIAHRTPPYTSPHNGDYALETAARIHNMVPTKKVEKTPYEVWHGKAPKLSYLKVWGCEVLVKRDTLTKPHKLEPRSIKCIFVGYPKKMMGYSFYYPPENKVLVARNAEFLENGLINQEESGSLEDLEIIQKEDMHPFIDTSLNHEEDDLEIDEP